MRISCAMGMVIAASLVGACSTEEDARFSGESARELVAVQLNFGDRIPGSEAHRQTGDWIIAQLETRGWEASSQQFEYMGIGLRNIIAQREQAGSSTPIIIATHYDTRPQADLDQENPRHPVPGANDGASGVAVLLELARVLQTENLSHPIWLVFFDAEDSGNIEGWEWIVGSTYFADNLTLTPYAVLVVDMVGDEDLQLYYERNSDPELSAEVWAVADGLGYESFIAQPKYAITDDHTPFLRAGMRAIDVIDFDYPYWHTTEDTLDKVSARSLEQVGRTLQVWLVAFQNANDK